jgi:hypothetical protein
MKQTGSCRSTLCGLGGPSTVQHPNMKRPCTTPTDTPRSRARIPTFARCFASLDDTQTQPSFTKPATDTPFDVLPSPELPHGVTANIGSTTYLRSLSLVSFSQLRRAPELYRPCAPRRICARLIPAGADTRQLALHSLTVNWRQFAITSRQWLYLLR